MKRLKYVVVCLCHLGLVTAGRYAAQDADRNPPFLATGVRVGEVQRTRAIVWVRLTASPERYWYGRTQPAAPPSGQEEGEQQNRLEFPKGWRLDQLEGSCPGHPGSARVVYSMKSTLEDSTATPWREAGAESDFVLQFPLNGLLPGTLYHYRVETRSPAGENGASFAGQFQTATDPKSEEPVTFTVVTGMMYRDLDHRDGFHIYQAMAALHPDFLVATGDTVYYDSEWPRARGVDLARFHWHRMYSLPRIVETHRRVPGYWIKDDHDTLDDDSWPGKVSSRVAPLTFEQGQSIFREQVPMGEKTYRTVRWGRHLQVWFVEGRDFRSPNTQEDGPEKTIWGDEQKRWLKKTLLESDATFRVLVSATPIVGPDRPKGKNDNHSNAAFRHEGQGFRHWARKNLPDRFYIVCGDRHWQYHSVDPETGVQEFSCGPASDKHAGGSPGLDPRYHRFHRVKGGFLSVTVATDQSRPSIAMRFHDVEGRVVQEYRETVIDDTALRVGSANASSEAGNPKESVLYNRLFAEAREKLTARAAEVESLKDPVSIESRSERIGKSIRDSFGGFPERGELNARVVGRVDREDHFMEKVIYESRPGFHVTANLYLPKDGPGPHPVILFPCGHSKNGKAGSTYQTAGQEFARRGFAVFVYDPIGQGERFQFLNESGEPIVGGTTEHTLTGTAALLVGSNTAEVIVWDGIRGVDYLATREDIDLGRLGCSGNSGGGTQTSYLMALEPRIRAAAPSCYLTSFERLFATIGPQDAEQNFTGFIRDGLDHADFVFAFAPRPALICCATGDFFDIGGTWRTYREAKRIYGRLGRPEAVDIVEIDAGHGYHPPIRQRVGRFFEATLMGRAPEDIVPTVKEGTVYPDADLQCTTTGQVLSSLKGTSVADLWRQTEAGLTPRRRELFENSPRDEWLAGVRKLAGMSDQVPAPEVRSRGRLEAEGVVIEKLQWDTGFPVTALVFRPTIVRPGAVEIIVDDKGGRDLVTRLTGRARSGEYLLTVTLPGYGKPATNERRRWGTEWKAAFLAFHLGRSLAGIRADALRQAIAYARTLPATRTLHVTGVGHAAIPALLASAMEPAVTKLRLEDGLESYAAIVEDGLHRDQLEGTIPGALTHFDLPLLRESMKPREVEVVRPTDPHGESAESWEF